MAFENVPVTSSCFSRLEYDDETNELIMRFADGRSYIVPNFPAIEVTRMANSASPGAYFNLFIRGKY